MTKKEKIENFIEKYTGYLITSLVCSEDISKTYIAKYIKEHGMERVSRGVYIADDVWPDELFILQQRNGAIIYSGETALYLHGLTDREYSSVCVTVPQGYNASHLKDNDFNVSVKYAAPDLYKIGICEIASSSGNLVKVYDQERCICDLIRNRNKYEVQVFQTAIKEYMSSKDKKLSQLILYADMMEIRDEVMKYVEGVSVISSSRQLKDKVRNISDGNSNKATTPIRNFMMERFLERVSVSSYRDNFILKGGMLVASIVGVDMRATMDIDTTVKALPLNEADVQRIIEEICNIPLEDNVKFQIKSTRTIMEEFDYPGIRVMLEDTLDKMFYTMHFLPPVKSGKLFLARIILKLHYI